MTTDFKARYIVGPDGLRLYIREYRASGTARPGPVFCLHGLTRNSADFEGIAPFLARSGWRVLVMDVRGRGRSDRDPDPSQYRLETYARDVLHVLDALEVHKAAFIGTSMGGLITMVLASLAPERIEAAVLNDVGPVLDPVGLARISGYVGNIGPFGSWSALTDVVRSTQQVAFPDADDKFWNTFAHRVARELPDGHVVLDYDPAIAEVFSQPSGAVPLDPLVLFAALANKPVLVLRGMLSDILALEGVNAMRTLKPDLRVAEIANVGHAPTLDEPAARQGIEEFLSGISLQS